MVAATFGDFLNEEIHKRDMSAREFARFVGVSHGVIQKFQDYGTRDVGYPSVEFLVKLALKTNTDICYLMMLIAPEVATTSSITPDAMILSQRIQQLPDVVRDALDDYIAKNAK